MHMTFFFSPKSSGFFGVVSCSYRCIYFEIHLVMGLMSSFFLFFFGHRQTDLLAVDLAVDCKLITVLFTIAILSFALI